MSLDYLIKGATIVDGSGSAPYVGNVGVKDGRIAVVGTATEVKDLDEGLVDFPAQRHGETVLLCWQLGEDEIRYWHTPQEGFAGRRPLPLD